jgi:hypothetical protein
VAVWPVRARFDDENALRHLLHVKEWTPRPAPKAKPRRKAKPKKA